ncbi:hypothetical protein RPIT_13990 [Tessaracoccus flavus]|uniref:Uncharacterized protein n=1 Tax=Tessaracoccus flavus TaxID=1610493 RepID=A0A1Q2CI96_9ACTN|nr:hypothetical protein RPIT_13990 [Tessaracoccus flavus]
MQFVQARPALVRQLRSRESCRRSVRSLGCLPQRFAHVGVDQWEGIGDPSRAVASWAFERGNESSMMAASVDGARKVDSFGA